MQLATKQKEDIIQYYDACHVDYQIVWHLNSKFCMHYGYWDDDTPNLRSALVRMNAEVADMVHINKGERVLDAGCGVGGSAFYLADQYQCEVEGITLSGKQVEFARTTSRELGLENRVHFSIDDFQNCRFQDGQFDVVWAIESACHSSDKAAFFIESFRTLKRGGRLVVADFFRNEHIEESEDIHWLEKWEQSWAVPSFESLDSFQSNAERAGFSQMRTRDVTRQIYPSARRLYYCFIPGLLCDGFLRIFGQRKRSNYKNVWSTLYQYKALKSNLWSYHFFTAIKE